MDYRNNSRTRSTAGDSTDGIAARKRPSSVYSKIFGVPNFLSSASRSNTDPNRTGVTRCNHRPRTKTAIRFYRPRARIFIYVIVVDARASISRRRLFLTIWADGNPERFVTRGRSKFRRRTVKTDKVDVRRYRKTIGGFINGCGVVNT